MLWRWPTPLVEGRLVRRYERFVAEVRVGRELLRAHCVNPGRMEGLVIPGSRVWLSEAPGRALPWTWELAELDGRLVGANTSLPNKLVGAALTRGLLREFREVRSVKAEQPMGRHHRVDFVVNGEHLVEVKNCHLVYPDGGAYFPDSVSMRGARHLRELAAVARAGGKASVVFIVQRHDARFVRPSDVHDPTFATEARLAADAGVTFSALRLRPDPEGVSVLGPVPVDLAPFPTDEPRRWRLEGRRWSGWERPPRKG